MVNEYTTAALVQAEIRATNTFSSSTSPTLTQLTTWIQEESNIIELKTGTIFGSNLESSTIMDYDGSGILRTKYSPIILLTKLEYNQYSNGNTPSWITLEEADDKDYVVYKDEGEIVFVSGVNSSNNLTPIGGMRRFRLTYNYGYSTTPLAIQRLATLLVAKRCILSLLNNQSNSSGGTIQVGTISITDPSNFGVNWFRNVSTEVESLYKEIGEGLYTFRNTRYY